MSGIGRQHDERKNNSLNLVNEKIIEIVQQFMSKKIRSFYRLTVGGD